MRGMMIIFSLGEQFYFMNRHHLITYGVDEFILLNGDFFNFFSPIHWENCLFANGGRGNFC